MAVHLCRCYTKWQSSHAQKVESSQYIRTHPQKSEPTYINRDALNIRSSPSNGALRHVLIVLCQSPWPLCAHRYRALLNVVFCFPLDYIYHRKLNSGGVRISSRRCLQRSEVTLDDALAERTLAVASVVSCPSPRPTRSVMRMNVIPRTTGPLPEPTASNEDPVRYQMRYSEMKKLSEACQHIIDEQEM